ncbi:uncharacterized protein N0V89_001629 [Didymosphaeria variabile]|uniref:F-box domain-containing protein n=1 Tax=Didymosphaeria variabile TaxID=1932322 RepID=A0A9W8XYG4_9PLEO|nr:uncharacterized protein N0V89_001629 [Didymosphaeria variabile]KAJ4361060.1 hypothetical protein N0V89_001629 [Didymosphaeria variabile]
MDVESCTPAKPPCSIQDLSTELVLMVLEYLPFESHFDFACTCRRLAVASRGVLERHQDAYSKYRVASDLDPATVPLLLRSAFGRGDPIPAWHVRSFEIWRDRASWGEWQMYSLTTPLVCGSECGPSRLRVSNEEAGRYLKWFEGQLSEELDEGVVEELLEQVGSGRDGILKALLFAKCERLGDLKFVTRCQEKGSGLASMKLLIAKWLQYGSHETTDNDSGDESDDDNDCGCDSCGENDTHMDSGNDSDSDWESLDSDDTEQPPQSTTTASWPPGFAAIRTLAVGVSSATWMDDPREDPSSLLFAHLLRLPNIHSIFFSHLRTHEWNDLAFDEDEDEYGYDVLPKGSSSIQHIFLHGCDELDSDVRDDLWDAPRSLLTISFRHDGESEFWGATGTANGLALAQKKCLRGIMWYGYAYGCLQGDHCTVLDNEEFDHFKRLPGVTQVSVSMQDVELAMEHADTYEKLRFYDEDERDDEDGEGYVFDDVDDGDKFFVRRLATLFPRSMETLVLWDEPQGTESALLDRAMVKIIQDGRYKNLKAIFLQDVERAREGPRTEGLWFQDAIAAGRAAGVDVHTLTNRGPMRHKLDFVEAPDEYDLRSGIHSGVRSGDWVFDAYAGRRVPLGCGKCGSCENCLAQYDARLWATMRTDQS